MKIGIDARMYGLEHAGIGRYVKNLITQLQQLDTKNSYKLFLEKKYFLNLEVKDNFEKVEANSKHYTLSEQTKFLKLVLSKKCELVHFPHFNVPLLYQKPFITTIHDILWHQQTGADVTTLPPIIYKIKYQGYKQVVNHAVKQSEKIIVPSNWVRQQLKGEFDDLNEKKVAVIYEGVDGDLLSNKKKVKDESEKGKYFVYVGSAYPHKNLNRLIDAIKICSQDDGLMRLKIISSRSVFLDKLKSKVKEESLSELVEFVGYLPDDELSQVLMSSIALIQPSLSEGFGLTGLEAMSLKVPVAAAKAGAMPEVYGDAACYFNPENSEDISKKLLELSRDKHLRSSLIKKGEERVRKYSWKKMTEQTLNLYNQT